eukprot:GGOE01037031.1.p1 GENE.GGOE01037031.1~~GGOE01037031.1.p1  ORF type:complete len:500 (+),score=135.68 GGOE01037031.1:48-1502(+)
MASGGRKRHVAVVVIGEFARSPRMMYHSLSLASDSETEVYLVGFAGLPLAADVAVHPRIRGDFLVTPLDPSPSLRKSFFLLTAILRVLLQLLQFLFVLVWRLPHLDVMLVQTPPAVPLLVLAHIVCWLRRSHLVIDWHNLGFTLMEVDHRPKASITFYKFVERTFGRGASANFCVSQSMQRWLQTQWNVTATVLHDKPQDIFHEYPVAETHALFTQSNRELLVPAALQPLFSEASTPFTVRRADGQLSRRRLDDAEAMGLVVSSTSWTADEDFSILLRALQRYDEAAAGCGQLPPLLVVVTGNGPKRRFYEERMEALGLRSVHFRTGYLRQFQDYAILLSSAHIGVSLHTSSSGIDLPMKVVDMLGCRLPVIALSFPALPELLQDNVTGLAVLNDGNADAAIAEHLIRLMRDETGIGRLRNSIHLEPWSRTWDAVARPVFERLFAAPKSPARLRWALLLAVGFVAPLLCFLFVCHRYTHTSILT